MFILSDALAPWGQAAAIILSIYLFVNILIGLAFAVGFMFAFAWLRQKAELVKKLRPTVDSVNRAIEAPDSPVPPESEKPQRMLVQAVHKVQSVGIPQKIESVDHQAHVIDQKIDQGADRVAEVMIEVRARTVMVQTMLKAFFLPGLAKPKQPLSLMEAHGFDRAVNRDGSGPQYSPEESARAVVARPALSDKVEDAQIEPVGARRADNAPVR